jgi:hypothetical protein
MPLKVNGVEIKAGSGNGRDVAVCSHFTNQVVAIFHAFLALMFIYCCKINRSTDITVQISIIFSVYFVKLLHRETFEISAWVLTSRCFVLTMNHL